MMPSLAVDEICVSHVAIRVIIIQKNAYNFRLLQTAMLFCKDLYPATGEENLNCLKNEIYELQYELLWFLNNTMNNRL